MYPGTHSKTTPEKPAIVMAETGLTVTYAQLNRRSLQLANWFRDHGYQRGDVVALISENIAQVFDVYWATQRAGLYITLVNFHLHPDEIKYILENSGSKAAFVGNIDPKLANALAEVKVLDHRVSIGNTILGFESLAEILQGASSQAPLREPRGADML